MGAQEFTLERIIDEQIKLQKEIDEWATLVVTKPREPDLFDELWRKWWARQMTG